MNADASFVTEIATLSTPYRFMDLEVGIILDTEFVKGLLAIGRTEFLIAFFRRVKGFFAVFTQRAHQALSEDTQQSIPEVERVEAHVEQPGHGFRCTIGM